jgi:hypothetical protein
MRGKNGRPRDGVLLRKETIAVAITDYEKAVLRAIAAEKGVSLSNIVKPLVDGLVMKYHAEKMTTKELVAND